MPFLIRLHRKRDQFGRIFAPCGAVQVFTPADRFDDVVERQGRLSERSDEPQKEGQPPVAADEPAEEISNASQLYAASPSDDAPSS